MTYAKRFAAALESMAAQSGRTEEELDAYYEAAENPETVEDPETLLSDLLEADMELSEKAEALESLLRVAKEVIQKNGLIDRAGAMALESWGPILPKHAQPNSFTLGLSKTNYSVATEAIDNKIIALITAIIGALIGLWMKFGGWSSDKADLIERRKEASNAGLPAAQVKAVEETIPKKVEELNEAIEESNTSKRPVTMKELTNRVLEVEFSKENIAQYPINLGLLLDTLKYGDRGPWVTLFVQYSKVMRVWEVAADNIYNPRYRAGIMATYAKNVGKVVETTRHLEGGKDESKLIVHDKLTEAMDQARNEVLKVTDEAFAYASKTMRVAKFKNVDKVFLPIPTEKGVDHVGIMGQVFRAMNEMSHKLGTATGELIEGANDNISYRDFPDDLLVELKFYREQINAGFNSPAFDVSDWNERFADMDGKKVNDETHYIIQKFGGYIKTLFDAGLVDDQMGATWIYIFQDLARYHASFYRMISIFIAQITLATKTYSHWNDRVVPKLLAAIQEIVKEDMENLNK